MEEAISKGCGSTAGKAAAAAIAGGSGRDRRAREVVQARERWMVPGRGGMHARRRRHHGGSHLHGP
jgi:hypothetical protein